MADQYGVWELRGPQGEYGWGIARSTFIIAPDGTVRHAWYRVKARDHAERVLAALSAMEGTGTGARLEAHKRCPFACFRPLSPRHTPLDRSYSQSLDKIG